MTLYNNQNHLLNCVNYNKLVYKIKESSEK